MPLIEEEKVTAKTTNKVVILGSPNVGKSVLFNHLTGRYVTVSNYPGTTVEVSRGKSRINGLEFQMIDTPGIYSFTPLSEEEAVCRRILFKEKPAVVLHLVDAKNLKRLLPLTLQLIEAHLPTVLVLNMMDEVREAGIRINVSLLERELGIPVVETVSTTGEGMDQLKQTITNSVQAPPSKDGLPKVIYDGLPQGSIETGLQRMEEFLKNDFALSDRTVGLLLMKQDEEIRSLVRDRRPETWGAIHEIVEETRRNYRTPLEYEIVLKLQSEASRIADLVFETAEKVSKRQRQKGGLREKLSRLTMNPWTGFPILFLVLYLGIYQFVGVFGAGTVVDFLEDTIFLNYINPFLVKLFSAWIPWAILRDLFVGEYGMLTLGVRYAVALILPIVTFYFAVFAVIEDSGYLPRLAMLLDRTFKKIGLSGRAVIPMVLGFGCDTMATMVTRTLPTVRERIIATILLSLTIPCSAQLGVIFGVLAGHTLALLIWAAVLIFVFLFIGFLTAQILPGEKASFYMELPPLRLPKITNVFTKTYVRVQWYFREVLPLFVIASALIWLGQLTGFFQLVTRLLSVPIRAIGLPDSTAMVFLMGFFRRDYGAAGLYDLNRLGLLNGVQLLVACIALTLFLPCVAQFLMNVKERGWKTGVGISVFTLFFSFAVAWAVNFALLRWGVTL